MPSAFRKLDISDEHTVLCPISAVIPETFYSMLLEFQTPASRWKYILTSREVESGTSWARVAVAGSLSSWALSGCSPRGCCFPDLELAVFVHLPRLLFFHILFPSPTLRITTAFSVVFALRIFYINCGKKEFQASSRILESSLWNRKIKSRVRLKVTIGSTGVSGVFALVPHVHS